MSPYVSPDPEYFEGFMRRVRIWMEEQGRVAVPVKIESDKLVTLDESGARSEQVRVVLHCEVDGQAQTWSLDESEQLSLWHFILFTTA